MNTTKKVIVLYKYIHCTSFALHFYVDAKIIFPENSSQDKKRKDKSCMIVVFFIVFFQYTGILACSIQTLSISIYFLNKKKITLKILDIKYRYMVLLLITVYFEFYFAKTNRFISSQLFRYLSIHILHVYFNTSALLNSLNILELHLAIVLFSSFYVLLYAQFYIIILSC